MLFHGLSSHTWNHLQLLFIVQSFWIFLWAIKMKIQGLVFFRFKLQQLLPPVQRFKVQRPCYSYGRSAAPRHALHCTVCERKAAIHGRIFGRGAIRAIAPPTKRDLTIPISSYPRSDHRGDVLLQFSTSKIVFWATVCIQSGRNW